MTTVRRGSLVLASGVTAIDTLLLTALPPLIPEYQSRGMTPGMIGLIMSGYSVGFAVAALPAGFLSRRYGYRGVLASGLVLLAVSSLIFGFGTSFVILFGARIVQGVASAFGWTATLAWSVSMTRPERRDGVYGLLFAAGFAGVTVGPLVGVAAERIGPQLVFGLLALAAAGLVLPVLAMVTSLAASEATTIGALRLLPATGIPFSLWLQALGAFSVSAVTVVGTLQLTGLGADAAFLGGIFVVSAIVQGFASAAGGRWTEAVGLRGPCLIALWSCAVLVVVLVNMDDRWTTSAALIFLKSAVAIVLLCSTSLLSSAVDRVEGSQSVGFGLLNLAFAVGGACGAVAGGLASTSSEQVVALLLIAAACVATAALVWRLAGSAGIDNRRSSTSTQ